jgi:NADH-quinone oxidoreductase subunit C
VTGFERAAEEDTRAWAGRLADATGAEVGAEVPVTLDGDGTGCLQLPRSAWVPAARYLRDRAGLDFFDWLSAVDVPDGDPAGADVVAHVAATTRHPAHPRRVPRLLLRTRVPDADPVLPSLTAVWPGVAWHERETHEMFGIGFTGFDDGSGLGLRPLLLPDGFEGTPLRKSFVLTARASKPWPGAKEPGESSSSAGHRSPGRRKVAPPGVPDPSWGPRDA